jgi:FAD synthase
MHLEAPHEHNYNVKFARVSAKQFIELFSYPTFLFVGAHYCITTHKHNYVKFAREAANRFFEQFSYPTFLFVGAH